MYVGSDDFRLAAVFLQRYDAALANLRPDLKETGLTGFREWLAVRLDSCVKSCWSEIILREDTGSEKFEALEVLFEEFSSDRKARGVEAILGDFKRLQDAALAGTRNRRSCWCELSPQERDQWRPSRRGELVDETV
jgi:hypothetical protein